MQEVRADEYAGSAKGRLSDVSILDSIICGDSVESLRDICSSYIDLVVTSPPYDHLRAYGGKSWDFERTVYQLYRVVKEGGVIIWVVADATINGSETGTSFRQALHFMHLGFRLHDTMIYRKNSYMPLTHNRYEQAWEYMFCFSKGRPKTFNPLMIPSLTAGTFRNRGNSKAREVTYAERKRNEKTVVNPEKQAPNIFTYDVGKNEKTLHNAPFPLELATDQIRTWSNEGDLILDPFCGSGTTCKAAKDLNRHWIGIDIEEGYCTVARQRVNGHNDGLFI